MLNELYGAPSHTYRPGNSIYSRDLQVKKLFWLQNGWPVVSPERYAWEDGATVAKMVLVVNGKELIWIYHCSRLR